jgi:hypothetical protein
MQEVCLGRAKVEFKVTGYLTFNYGKIKAGIGVFDLGD